MPHTSPIDRGTVLITGASSGIGADLARQIAPRAARLILVARRLDKLQTLRAELAASAPAARVDLYPADLDDPAALHRLADDVLRDTDGYGVDVLVNNAGFGHADLFERAPWDRLESMIRVNVIAPMYLTRRFLPMMVARGRGGVLNISSGGARVPMVGSAAYSTTKYALRGFSETLMLELAGTGVRVTESAPGPVATEFNIAAGTKDLPGSPPEFLRIPSALCARESIAAFDRGKPVVFPGQPYRTLMRIVRFLPRPLIWRSARRAARQLRARAAASQ